MVLMTIVLTATGRTRSEDARSPPASNAELTRDVSRARSSERPGRCDATDRAAGPSLEEQTSTLQGPREAPAAVLGPLALMCPRQIAAQPTRALGSTA